MERNSSGARTEASSGRRASRPVFRHRDSRGRGRSPRAPAPPQGRSCLTGAAVRRRPNCRWRKAQAAGQEPLRRASPPLWGRPGEGLVSRSSLSNEEAGRRAEGGTGGEDRMEKEKDGQDLGHGKMLTREKQNKEKTKQRKRSVYLPRGAREREML